MNSTMLFLIKLIFLCVICPSNGFILPNSTIPLQYELELDINFNTLEVEGSVSITVQIVEETNNIVLNSKSLTFNHVEITPLRSDLLSPVEGIPEITDALEIVKVQFPSALEIGLYQLEISFKKQLDQVQEGIYIAPKDTRPVVLTNFRYGKARKAFPCFDDPAFPATFRIRIGRPDDYLAFTNTQKTEEIGGTLPSTTIDSFAQTEATLPYLLSIAILPAENLQKSSVGNVNLYYYQTTGTELLLRLSARILEIIDRYRPEKLGKLDQIVLPDSLLPANLESNGLVFYKESSVLYYEPLGTTEEREMVYKTITHAFSAQWYPIEEPYGWENLWVNEGIAIYQQYEILKELEPEWRFLDQFIVKSLHDALAYDVAEAGIALSQEGSNSVLYNPHFYTKAFAFIRMLMNYRTPGSASEITQNSISYSWANLNGFPLVTVKQLSNSAIEITQTQFGSNELKLWEIPLNFLTIDGGFANTEFDNKDILYDSETVLDFSIPINSWILVNKQQKGYYRVNYDDLNWNLIANYLRTSNFNKIDPITRAQIIDDSFNLVVRGYISPVIFLEIITYIEQELDFIPLITFFKTTSQFKALLSGDNSQQKFMYLMGNLSQRLFESVGTNIKPTDTHTERLKRIETLTWLCSFEHNICQEEMFGQLSSFELAHPDMQEAAYCGGMRLGNEENFYFLYEQYKKNGKARILRGMGCTSNNEALEIYLTALIINNETYYIQIKPEDRLFALLSVIEESEEGVNLILEKIKANLDDFVSGFSENVPVIILALSKKIVTSQQKTDLDSILSSLGDEFQYVIDESSRNIDRNLQWRNFYLAPINEWLDKNIENTTPGGNTTPSAPTVTASTLPSVTSPPNVTELPITPVTPGKPGIASTATLEINLLVAVIVFITFLSA